MTEQLGVWFEQEQVGTLWRDTPRGGADLPPLGFTYTPRWVETGFRLSQHCYLQAEPYPAGAKEVHAFFSNLLPEGETRERIAQNARISRADVFGLLREYGGDCAGAFSILPDGITPTDDDQYQYLSAAELRQLIEMRGVLPFDTSTARPRLSLAGAQAKCPVYIADDGGIALPRGAAPSSHILKFSSNNYADLLINELFMLRLAAAVSLDPVAATFHWLDATHPYLQVARYDRVRQQGRLRRLHQQDLCQVQDLGDWAKYENRHDPAISPVSFASSLAAVREASREPVRDANRLLSWQIFNAVTGNSDAHAKNAALIQTHYRADEWRLAPFYDLVCVRVYPQVTHELALGIGGCFDPRQLTQANLTQLASDTNINPRLIQQRFRDITGQIETMLQATLSATQQEIQRESPILNKAVEEIRAICAAIDAVVH